MTVSRVVNRTVWILAGLLVVSVAGLHLFLMFKEHSVEFNTPYQAVLLSNGSVYFGHLRDYGTAHPVLTDVFYIVSQTNPETNKSTTLS